MVNVKGRCIMGQLRTSDRDDTKKASRLQATIMATATTCFGIGIFLTICLTSMTCLAAIPMMHNSDNVGTKYGTWGTSYTCSTCHSSSAVTPNIKQVLPAIATPIGSRPVEFRRVEAFDHTSSGVLGDDQRTYKIDTSTNVCEVCHHKTMYHQYSSSKLQDKVHTQHKDFQKECLVCHSHRVGFMPPQVGNCTDCHGYPPTKAADLFTKIMGASPPANGGAHGIHRLEEGMQCKACHNNNQHGLLGNDVMEFGFNIYSGSWPSFSGRVTSGTINISNDPSITWTIGPGQPNLGTIVNRVSGTGATCSIYCHGDNWNYPSGYSRTGPISWANGPLGACSNATCHGTTPTNPPTPVIMANVSTGAHKRHVGKNQYLCTACHDSYATPHMVNGRVKWNLSQQGTSATYKGFKIFSTSYMATTGAYGSCNNIACHSTVQNSDGSGISAVVYQSVTWGGGALACNSCHASVMTSGSHSKHTTGYDDRFSCSDCHDGAGKDNPAKHGNENIDVVFSATFGGNYSQTVNVPGDGYGTCSANYCHSDGNGATRTVAWGAAVNCSSCHGGDAGSGTPITSGKHGAHINQAGTLGSNYGCIDCHAKTVSDNNTISTKANHVNKFKEYSGIKAGKSSSYSSATGVCSASYCHTDGKGTQKDLSATGWNSAATFDCTGCHGSDAAPTFSSIAGEPNYANQGAGQTRANSHQKHMGGVGATSCLYCHGNTMNSGGTLIVASTTHTNKIIDVAQGGGKSFSYTSGTKTCGAISCHGTGSPQAQWGQTMPADCSGCHGGNATAATIIATGKHTAHINNAAVIGDNIGCSECHAKTLSAERTIGNSGNHANGFSDYSGIKAGSSNSYTAATGVCSASYCHTDGKGSLISMATDTWKGTTTLGCAGCHGRDATPAFTSVAGEPNYATSGGNLLRSNSHQGHTTKVSGYTGASSCDICHTNTVTTNGTAIKAGSSHLSRGIDVNFNAARATASWNPLTKTCNNISCHGGQNATWGDISSVACIVCHGSLSATHGIHISDLLTSGAVTFYNFTGIRNSGTAYRIGCANCHPTDPSKHRNGVVDLTINKNKVGANFVATLNSLATADGINIANSGISGTAGSNVVCAAAYCHSNGRIIPLGAGDFKASPNWYAASITTNRCGMCHDNPPQYAGQSHYVATSSLGNNGVPPYADSGHMVGIHFKTTAKGNNENGFLGFSSSGNVAHGNAAVATTISCYICHSGIVSPATIDTYAMNGSTSKFRCGSCHTGSSRTRLQNGLIINTALHINGVKNVVFSPTSIKTKAQLATAGNALGWTRNGIYKAADSYDSADLSVSTWDSGTKTCLTACHVNQPNIIWGAALQCVSCHANQ